MIEQNAANAQNKEEIQDFLFAKPVKTALIFRTGKYINHFWHYKHYLPTKIIIWIQLLQALTIDAKPVYRVVYNAQI
jgi:hypothetical protein